MKRAIEVALDAIGFAGVGAIIYGAWLIYQPAAYLIGGGVALAGAVILPRYLD